MKTHLAAAAAALVLSTLCTSPLFAAIEFAQQGDYIKLYDGSGGRGGVFSVDVVGVSSTIDLDNNFFNGGTTTRDFRTFCVEIFENIGFNTTYYVSDVSDKTVNGNRYLGSLAAWVYTEYLAPFRNLGIGLTTLSGYGTGHLQANAIQRAIWLSMNYTEAEADSHLDPAVSGGPKYDSTFFDSIIAAYEASTWAGPTAGSSYYPLNTWNWGDYTGQVAIMNLTNGPGGSTNYQDQLVIDGTIDAPPPPGELPEPVSFFVWSMLAMCIGTLGLRSRD